jgi:hypothetical protein
MMSFELTSTVFPPEGPIPAKYTCDGDDISLPLQWGDPPEGTQSFALIADDPDAPVGTWVHWVLFNVPGDTRALPEAVPMDADLPDGSRHGQNSWGRLGYGGPCPPGDTQRYFFKLYALDVEVDLASGVGKEELLPGPAGRLTERVVRKYVAAAAVPTSATYLTTGPSTRAASAGASTALR